MAKKKQSRKRVPMHIWDADRPAMERLRKLIMEEAGLTRVLDPDVLGIALRLAAKTYEGRAAKRK